MTAFPSFRSTVVCALMAAAFTTTAQSALPQLPASGRMQNDFIPERWTVLDTAIGDLNADGREDVALVLQCPDSLAGDTTGRTGAAPTQPRKLVVLFGKKHGYRLGLDNDRFILRSDEGGMFDPFEGIAIQDGVLRIHFYGGSAWRYSATYSFRWNDDVAELIGAERIDHHATSGEGQRYAFDLVTGRLSITATDPGGNGMPVTAEVQDLPKTTLRTFETFQRPFTWEILEDLYL